MGKLHVLCPSLLVEDLCVQLLDLDFGVVVELLHHVPVHLDVVTLTLHFTHFLLQQFQVIV